MQQRRRPGIRPALGFLVALLATVLAGCDEPQRAGDGDSRPAAAGPASIRIDPARHLGPVNRLVFGHNIEAGNAKGIFTATDSNHPRSGNGAWDPAARAPVADTVAWARAIGMGMLRYPGGCLTHAFDWRAAVGPLAERGYVTFGLDEYLTFCRAVGAAPLITVSEIAGPAEAAALVEYLNAPADEAHPWARKRAAWGHPEPWAVTWFEMANESDHGNHDVKPRLQRSASEYADWVLTCAAAMRAVDAGVRIGAHVGTGTPVTDPWNVTVLGHLRTRIDFVAVHTYAVGSPAPDADPETVGRACMAATEQVGAQLADYRALIRRCAGADLPLAVSEYNAGFVQERPLPWRFSFAAALHSADQLRLMLEPGSGVVMAHYWQFLNGYWGFLRGPEVPPADVRWRTTAAAAVFRLWGGHVGATLVAQEVIGAPRLAFAGFKAVVPAEGEARVEPQLLAERPLAFTASAWKGVTVVPAATGAATVTCRALSGDRYHNLAPVPVVGGRLYRLEWEQRILAGSGFSMGMGLCDARGYEATRSACGSNTGTPLEDGWLACAAEMTALPDAAALMPVLRITGSPRDLDAAIGLRRVRLSELSPRRAPAYAAITAHASLDADGRTLHVIVFNKHHAEDLTLDVAIADGSARGARAWCVTGPFAGTNLVHEEVREVLSGAPVPAVAATGFRWTFPARSMTAFAIAR